MRRAEPLDDECKRAYRDYQRAYRRAYRARNPEARERDRWFNNTRGRALERLAREYPERMAQLVAEERATHGPYARAAS